MTRAHVGWILLAGIVTVGCGPSANNHGSGNGDGGPDIEFGDGGLLLPKWSDGGGVLLHGDGGLFINFDAACATSMSKADRVPADLVFMFDRSDSMNNKAKWPPCAIGLKAFFADPMSAGVNASIQFFCGGGGANTCPALTTQWTTPAVPLSPLPDAVQFATSIDAQKFCNGTPTNPALSAAIAFATSIQKPGRKVAVVLVTDGEPTTCGSIGSVVAIAKAAAATIPTYVIGVGKSLKNLNSIADAGGTKQAILVDTANPQQTAQDFQTALNAVRGDVGSCVYGIPSPPSGQTLDPANVNVVLTTGGMPGTIGADPGCTAGKGWRYDDPAAPKQILLCGSSCDTVKNDPTAKVDVLFGCSTVVP